MSDINTIDRRRFLALASSSVASYALAIPLSGCTHKKLLNPDEDIVISGGSYQQYDKHYNALIIINLTQKEKRVIQCDFVPHEIIIHPADKHLLYCFEKDGPNACTIELQTLTISHKYQCSENHVFSGHAVFSKDGKNIYTIETEQQSKQGTISIRDAATFETVKQLPTLGLSPHDCQLTNQHTLVVSNSGQSASMFHQPSLVYIEMKTEKLLSRVKLDKAHLNAGHFTITKDDTLVIASAPVDRPDKNKLKSTLGGISIKTAGEAVQTMIEPQAVIQRMSGEALGISIHQQHNIAAITHPEANMLSFWSLDNKKMIKAVGIENPRGISQTLDRKNFIVSYGKKPAMGYIATDDLTAQDDSIVQPTLASGEHLMNWSQGLRDIMPKHLYD